MAGGPSVIRQMLQLIAALPTELSDIIFEKWQPQQRLQYLHVFLTTEAPLAEQLGHKLKRFCLTNMAIEKTEIVANASEHIGIAIPTPESESQIMTAAVYVSRMASLKNKRVSGEINFIGLSATECRHAFQYLRNHVRLANFKNTLIILKCCRVQLIDLLTFCRGITDELSFSRILFYGTCEVVGGVVQMLQDICCHDIQYCIFDNNLRNRNYVLNMLTNVRRSLPLQTLEIDYCRGPVDVHLMAAFIQKNMAENSTLAIYVDKMEYRATFYQLLQQHYNGPPLQVAFHRNHRTNEWQYHRI